MPPPDKAHTEPDGEEPLGQYADVAHVDELTNVSPELHTEKIGVTAAGLG